VAIVLAQTSLFQLPIVIQATKAVALNTYKLLLMAVSRSVRARLSKDVAASPTRSQYPTIQHHHSCRITHNNSWPTRLAGPTSPAIEQAHRLEVTKVCKFFMSRSRGTQTE
jgi:hypothetical protein